ncbi:MAG: Cof-type HAD-IIB family hydrolase [Treponema sp.]
MQCKVIFSDIDGTLLNSDHIITPLTRKAIYEKQQSGVQFVIVSARGPTCIAPILKDNNIQCPIICYSGALILDENRNPLFQNGIEPADAQALIRFISGQKYDTALCIYAHDQWIVRDKNDERVKREESIVQVSAQQGSLSDVTGSTVHKLLCMSSAELTPLIETALKAQFPQYSIVKSSGKMLEIMQQGVNKAEAVKRLCALWNINIKDTIAFGDNYNDAEMLTAAGHGYLMANAPEPLKKQLDGKVTVTLDNNHDGIAHILNS